MVTIYILDYVLQYTRCKAIKVKLLLMPYQVVLRLYKLLLLKKTNKAKCCTSLG